jgi:uncharacterized phage protein (TIGR01671 family)
MQRPIIFRAWTGKEMREAPPLGEWDFEDCDFFAGYNKKPTILMQYTGLKDKNGVPIYEGDILQREETEYYENGPVKDWCTVYWHNSAWFVDFHGDEILPIDDYDGSTGEVIGNIYENGDLLE